MKRNLFRSGVICLAFVLGIMTHACVSTHVENIPSGPHITIIEQTFDFMEVTEEFTAEHTFRVLNRGDKVLEIKRVKPSRGCIVVRFDRAIPPGGEGDITLKLKIKGFQGDLSKSAIVYSNDPKHPWIKLTLKAQVKVPISVEPRGVFLEGFKDDDITKVVTIRAHKDRPLTIEPVKLSLAGRMEYELKTIEEGRVYQAVLRNISREERRYNGFLTLKTNYPEKPEIAIRFVANISGILQFQPEMINFGRIDTARLKKLKKRGQSPYQRSVMVKLHQGDNLKIKKIEINQELFKTHVKEIQAGKSYRIDVILYPEKLPKEVVSEKMRVYTNSKDDPVKVISIRVEKI